MIPDMPKVASEKSLSPDLVTKNEFNLFVTKVEGEKFSNRQGENLGDLKDAKDDHQMRIASLEGQIELLKKMNAPSNGDGGQGLLDVLNDITDKMRKEFQDKLDDLSKRIEQVDKESKDRDSEANITLDDHEERLKKLEGITATLQDEKADKVDVNNDVLRLEKMIEDLGSGKPVEVRVASAKGPKISDADVDKWNKAADKVNKHETLIEKLSKDMDELDKLKGRVANLEKKQADFLTRDEFAPFSQEHKKMVGDMKDAQHDIKTIFNELEKLKDRFDRLNAPTVEDFSLLRSRVDKLENGVGNLRKQLEDLLKKMKNMNVGGGGGADADMLQRAIEELERLRKEFEEHRDHANAHIDNINNILPTKADKQDLIDLQNSILDKLRDMIQQILNQFANKDDVMKRFAQLSKKIKEIMELLSKQGGGPNEDDAMFSKRHLGPQACASCEKNLINMYGQQADYYVWKKLPFRDPSERIARYGPGFSKILSHMKPSDLLGNYSPSRNPHHSSIDDTHVNYHHGHTGSAGNGDFKGNTADAFYRGKATANDRRGGSNKRGGAFSSTNPGSSIDEGIVNMGDPHGSQFASPMKNRGGHMNSQLQNSSDTLPKLGQQRQGQ